MTDFTIEYLNVMRARIALLDDMVELVQYLYAPPKHPDGAHMIKTTLEGIKESADLLSQAADRVLQLTSTTR